MDFSFTLTEKAIDAAKVRLEKRKTPEAYIRLGVSGSGCNGFEYKILFEDNLPREQDRILTFGDVKVLIDKKSAIYLNGATLDYEETLMEQGFIFRNDKEVSKCGCGKSVNFK